MDQTITGVLPVFKETRFRTPSNMERRCGLWVDRIGAGGERSRPLQRLRILGQCAVVAIEEGDGQLVTAGRGSWGVQRGDVILLTPSEPATYGPNKSWHSRWIVWNGPEAEAILTLGLKPQGVTIIRQAAPAVYQAFQALDKRMDSEDLASVVERKAVLLNLMADLIRAVQSNEAYQSTRGSIDRVMAHIQRHLDSRLSLPKLARMGNLSVPHFHRLFRRHTGYSPVEFIRAQRVSRAKQLLMRGASIKSAGAEVGYADPAYFMRVFKKTTGQSAGRFVSENQPAV